MQKEYKEMIDKLSRTQIVTLMENVRTIGLSDEAIQDSMAQIAWAIWNANMCDWNDVCGACTYMGIKDPGEYWAILS